MCLGRCFLVSVGKKLDQDDILKASRARVYDCWLQSFQERSSVIYIYIDVSKHLTLALEGFFFLLSLWVSRQSRPDV